MDNGNNWSAPQDLGAGQTQQNYGAGFNNSFKPQYPMKWFKFLIYFALFAGVVINLATGIRYLSGEAYGNQSDFIYRTFGDDLELTDKILGVYLVLLAAFMFFVRFRLSGFKKDGPMLFYVGYAISIAASVIYVISVVNICGSEVVTSTLYSSIAFDIAYLLLNYKYFSRRRELFCN